MVLTQKHLVSFLAWVDTCDDKGYYVPEEFAGLIKLWKKFSKEVA
jgi:hypothetical protein